MENPPITYVMVHNIPLTYRSCDLRNFFTQIVETDGFRCFHFRHRLEVQKVKETEETDSQVAGSSSGEKCRRGETCCCITMVRTPRLEELLSTYNGAFWVTREGETLNSKCYLRKVTIAEDDLSAKRYLRPIEERKQRPRCVLTRSDLRQMIELRPPSALPAGNVGTPTSYILRQINACNFPAQLIRKLGLEFPRTRAKGMYGNVPMDYATSDDPYKRKASMGNDTTTSAGGGVEGSSSDGAEFRKPEKIGKSSNKLKRKPPIRKPAPDLSSIPTAEEIPTFTRTLKGHVIGGGPETQKETSKGKDCRKGEALGDGNPHREDGESKEEDSASDDGEEWDRHESLHNDVTSQERTKERLFEEEAEVVWEKGGSGLVFYTDAQFWDEAEGDFDAKTSDDWDIDTSVYYADGAGDKDAKDFVSMEHFKRLRAGKEEDDDNRIGYFEKFTKGFGRRILEGQGWSEGRGVGKSTEGPSEPVETNGQHPRDRSGFGYRGEKIDRTSGSRRRRKDEDVDDWGPAFSSIYDRRFAEGEDPNRHDRNARSQEPTLLKYRKVFVKNSGGPSNTAK